MLQGKWLLKHRFVHEKKMKLGNTPQEQKELARPGIEFVQIKKAFDFVHLQVG